MKHIQDIRSVQNLKTLRGERMGSMPKKGRALFLDLYVQEKEKERILQEIKILSKKILLNEKKLDRTVEQINFLKNSINAEEAIEDSALTKKLSPLKVANFGNSSRVKNKKKRR